MRFRAIAAAFLLCGAFMLPAYAQRANPQLLPQAGKSQSACVADGGSTECSQLDAGTWRYGFGEHGAPSSAEGRLRCQASGGTWQTPAAPDCLDPAPVTASNYFSFARKYAELKHPAPCTVSGSGTGFVSTGCTPTGCQHTPIESWGILARQWNELPFQLSGPTCSGVVQMQGSRDRLPACPATYAYEQNGDGTWMCVKVRDNSCSVGGGTRPAGGSKTHADTDLAGGDFTMTHRYASDGFHRPAWQRGVAAKSDADDAPAMTAGDYWSHDFAARLHAVDTEHASVAAVRPNLRVKYFGADGWEIGSAAGNRERVVAVS